jgi:hypothetical protein
MLLALASVVFLGSESLWTRSHILLSQICDFLFRRLLRLAGSRWRYSTPPPHRVQLTDIISFVVQPRHGPHRKYISHYCVLSRCRGNVSTELFPSNGCCTVACLQGCYLARGLYVTILHKGHGLRLTFVYAICGRWS